MADLSPNISVIIFNTSIKRDRQSEFETIDKLYAVYWKLLSNIVMESKKTRKYTCKL